ncbi:hypothetical protein M231_04365 [Tremella mesenterica]|uniref:Alpha-1,6-mannosyl-glycoprotein 6-beta-N-acetylglucosaminyltransferase n=1 Tax=Tremella mesenterica TaxID=5217 RepID=A0A4Q1BKM0_TREME|nr:hypothetical protein M231_04365 [Tremella mesenterica]
MRGISTRRRISILLLVSLLTICLLLGFDLRERPFGLSYLTSGTLDRWDGVNNTNWKDTQVGEQEYQGDIQYDQQNELECTTWDPRNPEEDDPKECVRARQWRQVQTVIEREEKAEHEHWYFTKEHNLATFRNVSRCFLPQWHEDYKPCPDKPLIISGWWYTAVVVVGGTSGETIWQASLYKQLRALDMEVALVGPYKNWVQVAEMMPDVYRFLWNSETDTVSCITDPRCVAKEHYVPPEDGKDISIGVPDDEKGNIPIWKLQVVDYWGCKPPEVSNNDYWWNRTVEGDWSFQPLGQEWIATPWPLPGHFHLPYSIEDYCLPLKFKPHEERENTVLIFAKRSSYFDRHYIPQRSFWTALAAEPDFEIISTAEVEEGHPMPDGLETLGPQSREAYEALVGNAKVLLGMGAPYVSPSVYTALCQGTPVVLPTFLPKPRMDGWHLYSGLMQHGPAMVLGPPYVYTYHSGNYTSLLEVLQLALKTPIGRYIPDDMHWSYAINVMEGYINRDLESMYRSVISSHGGIPRMSKGARERCFQLGRCEELPPGKFKLNINPS